MVIYGCFALISLYMNFLCIHRALIPIFAASSSFSPFFLSVIFCLVPVMLFDEFSSKFILFVMKMRDSNV